MFLLFILDIYFASIILFPFTLKLPNIAIALISLNDYRTLVIVYLDMVDLQTEWTARFAHR